MGRAGARSACHLTRYLRYVFGGPKKYLWYENITIHTKRPPRVVGRRRQDHEEKAQPYFYIVRVSYVNGT